MPDSIGLRNTNRSPPKNNANGFHSNMMLSLVTFYWIAGGFILTAILIYLIIAAMLVILQSRYVYFPSKEIEYSPADIELHYEEVNFKANDGLSMNGWYLPYHSADRVVLFCHGNGGNISHRLDTLKILNDMGLNVFIFDYRGYGRSEGNPSEKGTYMDTLAAWNYLVLKKGFKPDKIIIHGRSLGGAIASWLAVRNRPGWLIVESAFTSIPEIGAKFYPFLPVKLLTRYNYNTRAQVRNIKCPILVIHSRDDNLIPFNHGQRIFEAASEPKTFLEISGDHNDGFLVSAEKYKLGITAFLNAGNAEKPVE